MNEIKQYADDDGIDFVIPRMSFKQTFRSNNPIDNYRFKFFFRIWTLYD